jgi:hypothetical protein
MEWLSACSGNATCVEVAQDGDFVLVRDSKLGEESPVLVFDKKEWGTFLEGVKRGLFEIHE